MSIQNPKDGDELDRVVAAAVDHILSAADDDILGEVREQHGDEESFVADVGAVFHDATNQLRLQRGTMSATAAVPAGDKVIQFRNISEVRSTRLADPAARFEGREVAEVLTAGTRHYSVAAQSGAGKTMLNTTPGDYDEDLGYSSQFFTISRRGHTSATAECGAPTLVWHVAFWPRRQYDPFSVQMTADGRIKDADAVIKEFSSARGDVVKDFNAFLERLQARGRHPAAPRRDKPFELRRPRDWDAESEPFEVFDAEATGFTLWWPDSPPAAGGGPIKNVMSDRPEARPVRSDLRVRVQAEVSIDYSVITFFIDAGKPWGESPVYLSGDGGVPEGLGERREKIFGHVKNIKTISEERLEAVDRDGKRLIDLDRLPEPDPICGASSGAIRLEHGFTDCAEALKAAADYLYEDIWKEFCRDFDFNINSIAGETDVVFANFRGLVASTCGTKVTEHGKLVKAPEPKDLSETSHPGSTTFSRFDGGGEDKVEPNAVVKAYMPFMRRFRAEGDWRDWIACGIFDWRAIYITAVGAQSEFAAFDESNFDLDRRIPSVIPAGHVPERRVNGAGKPETERPRDGERRPPTTAMNDRPAPFRYLLLTKFEPHRMQVGRMVDRINSLGARRLFALKDWSVIQNASVWINHYGRQLDAAFEDWIRRTERLQKDTFEKTADLDGNFWPSIQSEIDALGSREVDNIRLRYLNSPRLACPKLRKLAVTYRETTPGPWDALLRAVDEREEDYRTIDGDHDASLAEINRAAEHALLRITGGLDKLGDGAVGGLPYRIARSRYYSDTFRDAQINLRVGAIETWWSYDQFAKRGMEPVLKFIASVGERLEKLRMRLQTIKQDILQRSIAIQTEATRDNTHRLERIQSELKRMAEETHGLNIGLLQLVRHTAEVHKETASVHKEAAQIGRAIAQLRRWRQLGALVYAAAGWTAGAIGGAVAVWAWYFKAH